MVLVNMNLRDHLTIVIPIDLSRRTQDILQRIRDCAKALGNSGYQVILGCNLISNQIALDELSEVIDGYHNFHLVFTDTVTERNLSLLRNIAIDQVKTEYVLFLDVDILVDLKNIDLTFNDFLNCENKICMYPCLYVGQKGVRYLKKHSHDFFIDSFYNYRRDLIQHLAFPSSILIVDLDSVKAINGFDENFMGHGYEDFDFLIRIFKLKKLIDINAAVLQDRPYLAPLMCQGFRASLIQPFLHVLKTKHYFIHKYHPKDPDENYYLSRATNRKYFLNKLSSMCTNFDVYYNVQLIYEFEKLFESDNEDMGRYSALWAEIPAHMFRGKNKILIALKKYFRSKISNRIHF